MYAHTHTNSWFLFMIYDRLWPEQPLWRFFYPALARRWLLINNDIQLRPEEKFLWYFLSSSDLKKSLTMVYVQLWPEEESVRHTFWTHPHLPTTMWILVQLELLYLNTARWNECDLYKKNKSNLVQTFNFQSIYLYAI
jgi:hypothetical protein